MYSNNIILEWPDWSGESLSIWYYNIDYAIGISGDNTGIRWSWGWWLLDNVEGWALVKMLLSNIVQQKPIQRHINSRLPHEKIILCDELGYRGPDSYFIFERIKGHPNSLRLTIQKFIDWVLWTKHTVILCNPQADLFKRRNIPKDTIDPVVFWTKEDIARVMQLAEAVYKVQRKNYPDITI